MLRLRSELNQSKSSILNYEVRNPWLSGVYLLCGSIMMRQRTACHVFIIHTHCDVWQFREADSVVFVLHLFYLSRQAALTGNILHCQWPKYRFFSGIPVICYLLSFEKLLVNPVHFLLTESIKGAIKGWLYIISLLNSKYKHQWINVITLVIITIFLSFLHSRVTRRVPLEEQELLIRLEHLNPFRAA